MFVVSETTSAYRPGQLTQLHDFPSKHISAVLCIAVYFNGELITDDTSLTTAITLCGKQ